VKKEIQAPMPLLLPNLDDRTWADLTAEGTSLIPVYGPEWTDQNYSDPGITLVELAAAIAEMDIYQLNQISDVERLKFLALVGIAPQPPIPANVVLSFTLANGIAPVSLPESLEFEGNDPFGIATRYRILHPITLVPGGLAALQFQSASAYQNLTPMWRRHAVMSPFGAGPEVNAAFYLGLTAALPANVPVQIFFTFADNKSTSAERRRLLRQANEVAQACQPTSNPCQKISTAPAPASPENREVPKHYGVRTVWEYLASQGGSLQWVALDSSSQAIDDTRCFTLNGNVTFSVPGNMAAASIGAVVNPYYYYLRCRLDAGSYDAAPLLQDVAFNGVCAVQAVPSVMSFPINANASVVYSSGTAPGPNDVTTLRLTLDQQRHIVKLVVGGGAASDPGFRILNFKAPSATAAGTLCLQAVFLGFGNGLPHQQVTVNDGPVEPGSFRLYTLEDSRWNVWDLRADFDSSSCKDFHAVLDATAGTITFGDGEHGRVPPDGCEILAVCLNTRAQAGNLAAQSVNQLADSPHNHALLFDPTVDGWKKLNAELSAITNSLAASGGAAAETIDHAAGRADQVVESSGRAVTLADYERLAAQTPGTRIARVTAIAGMHPSFPCCQAPGIITVIVLPYLPQGQPVPTPGLLRTVSAYLRPRRVIGTRVEVVGPTYLDVVVQASVQSDAGTNKTTLQQAIIAGINTFLDPLVGGPDGTGWPFGRDVYRSEIMKVIDSVTGVDYIASLALIADCGQPQCGNVCLGPTWLVAAGAHQITVL